MIIQSYKQLGGTLPETATITNVLANQGLVSPHNGRPFSEEMILGIAGGLGCGYILWEFKKYDSAILVMGFQNRWNYTVEFMQNLCNRLGVTAEFVETGGQKKAQTDLETAINNGRAAIAWVDQESLPYFHLRPMYNGCFTHFVTVFGLEDGRVWLDDRAQKPVSVDAKAFSAARARTGSYKNRLLLLDSSGVEVDLAAAVRAGIEDCIEHLGRDSKTFAIPVYEKWAKMMTDTQNKKGWPVVFKDGKGLYSTLRSMHEGIKLFGTDGGGLRFMYGDFLDEAAPILKKTALNEAANQYREAGRRWMHFADTVLPDHIAPLRETRHLLAQKYPVYCEKGGDGFEEVAILSQKLTAMEEELNSSLVLSESEMNGLFSELQEQLYELYEVEKRALHTLQASMTNS